MLFHMMSVCLLKLCFVLPYLTFGNQLYNISLTIWSQVTWYPSMAIECDIGPLISLSVKLN